MQATTLVQIATKQSGTKQNQTKPPTKRAVERSKAVRAILETIPSLLPPQVVPTENDAIHAARLFLQTFSDPLMTQAVYSAKLGSHFNKVLKGISSLVTLSKNRRALLTNRTYKLKRSSWMTTYRRSGKPAAKRVREGLAQMDAKLKVDLKEIEKGFFGAAHCVAV